MAQGGQFTVARLSINSVLADLDSYDSGSDSDSAGEGISPHILNAIQFTRRQPRPRRLNAADQRLLYGGLAVVCNEPTRLHDPRLAQIIDHLATRYSLESDTAKWSIDKRRWTRKVGVRRRRPHR